jgi:hypothetical protein
MRGDALAQLNVLTSMSNIQEYSPRAGQHIYIDVSLRIEPLSKFHGRQTRLSLTRQIPCLRPSPLRVPRVHGVFKFQWSIPTDRCVLRSRALASVAPSNAVQKGLKPRGAATDVAQRPSLLCTEAALVN